MFELPEVMTLARQMEQTLPGKVIHTGRLGNSPHKFVWYNHSHAVFENLTRGKAIGRAYAKGKWLFLPVEPGYVLVLGEFGGKVLLHSPLSEMPKKYHLCLEFADGSFLTALTQMWGAFELYEKGMEQEREYIKGMKPTPVDDGFTFKYFDELLNELVKSEKRSLKSLLTQEQTIPGLGNAIVQDILFAARLHPRRLVVDLDAQQRKSLYQAIVDTVNAAIQQRGRYDEVDLFNHPGGYIRMMDKNALNRPCPGCGGGIEKINYLGGACYVCPNCQT